MLSNILHAIANDAMDALTTRSTKTAKRKNIMRTFTGFLLLVSTLSAIAASNELRDLQVSSLPGERVLITLVMAKTATNPVSFTMDNPAGIVMDFIGTRNRLLKRSHRVAIGLVRDVKVIEAKGRTRMVINLAKLVAHNMRTDGNKIYVTLGNGTETVSSSTQSYIRPRQTVSNHGIRSIKFRRGEKGEGRVIVTLDRSSTAIDISDRGGKIVVDFGNTRLPAKLERRLDVLDFATPVKIIDTYKKGSGARMEITPLGKYEHLAYQSNNVYTIEIRPIKKKALKRPGGGKGVYTGDKLTLNFQNIKVRAVLQVLADFTKKNIIVSDSVKGSLTLRLKNVPWDQALDIILKSKGLAMRSELNVIRIAPTEEISQIEQAELTARRKAIELAPMHTEWFQINFANAEDIAKTIKNKNASLLSARGSAVVDKRTNTLMIHETTDKLNEIRGLIKRLDIPVRQVLIEARIVIASTDFSKNIGVRLGLAGRNTINNGRDFITAGGRQNTDGTLSNNLMVDMGVNTPKAGRFGFTMGRLGDYLLQLELSALQAEGKGEIVSSPRLVTANKKQAFIEQGLEIPYTQSTSSGAASIQFKKAVLSLKVTPQITPDDRIILDLNVKKDAANFSTTFKDGVPGIDTREIKTQVLVNNGETIVLGGIYEATTEKDITRVPVLGKIPILGALFRDKAIVNKKSELLIFVTPKIIKDGFSKAIN